VASFAARLGHPELAAGAPAAALASTACDEQLSATYTVGGELLGEVVGLAGEDAVSTTFAYHVAFRRAAADLSATDLLGARGVVELRRGAATSLLAGVVTEAGLATGFGGEGAVYAVRLEPAVAALARGSGYDVWQEVSSPEVLAATLAAGGVTHASTTLTASYGKRVLETRYAESRWAFASRLLERDGVHYHFVPAADGEALVVGDANAVFEDSGLTLGLARPGAAGVLQLARRASGGLATAVVHGYDFERPVAPVGTRSGTTPAAAGEAFRLDWAAADRAAAQLEAVVELERSEARAALVAGASNAPALAAGRVVSFELRPLGGRYLVTAVRHLALRDEETGCLRYANAFEAIPSDVTFRPERRTPAPSVAGVVTAVVTGRGDALPATDKFGRVKVRFRWDRASTPDETSSAWIRVLLPAGRTHGRDLWLPDVGSEVAVAFLGGDPSQPVVLGNLYDGSHLPPVQLPGSVLTCGTQSFIDVLTDPRHCGSCGRTCSANGVAPACSAGQCAGVCLDHRADCNANLLDDGCEVDLMTSPLHCGACGNACPLTVTGLRRRCVEGVCE
jgi:type VI secretion system secreted protein VgrG